MNKDKGINNIFDKHKALGYVKIIILVFIIINVCHITITSSIKSTQKKIQNTISNFEKDSDELFNYFANSPLETKLNYNQFFENYNINEANNIYTTLIYVDSSLVYWSNNSSNYPWHINPILEPGYIMETNNSIVYKKIYCYDASNFFVTLLPITHTYNVENKYLQNGFPNYFKVSQNYQPIFEVDVNSNNLIYNSDKIPIFAVQKNVKLINYNTIFNFSIIAAIAIYLSMLIVIKFYGKPYNKKSRQILIVTLSLIALRVAFYLLFEIILTHNAISIDNNKEKLIENENLLIMALFFFIYSISTFLFCYHNNISFILNKKTKWLYFSLIILLYLSTIIHTYYSILNSSIEIQFFNLSNINIHSVLITTSMLIFTASTIIISLAILMSFSPKRVNKIIFKHPLTIIIITSLILALIYNYANFKRDTIIAERISHNNIFTRNLKFESRLSNKFDILYNDSTANNLSLENLLENGESQHLNDVIYSIFKGKLWNNYYIKYIIAQPHSTLKINRDSIIYNCNNFFNSIIDEKGISINNHIWYINDLMDIPYYLCLIDNPDYNIWIDVIPKYNIEGIGYPELLSTDERFNFQINISEYSIALYQDKVLLRSIGKFTYPLYEDTLIFKKNKNYAIHKNYKHFIYRLNDNDEIIITKPYGVVNSLLFPLSIFSTGFLIILLIIYILIPQSKSVINRSLNYNLRIYVISFFILAFTIIGASSVYLIYKTNNNKNINILQEKTYSLYKDIELIVNSIDECTQETMTNIIKDLSYSNFIDINIYDEDGYLYSTSNEEMFNNNLTSNLIYPTAYAALLNNNRYFCEESIGKYKFHSSYIIFVDKFENLYIINIPYFTKQTELKKEISDYITSFLNIYFFLVFIAVLIVFIFTKLITRPLKDLQNSISNLTIQGKEYEKIEYNRNDEIGALVKVYNNKIDELKKNAELLAMSERESAWREMARQVAHEIKNPLTPMKLSTQFIYKMWKENNPNFNSQFEKYKESLISEINNLSDIATAFSDFAKMPVENKKTMNINEFIVQIIDFYKQTNIDIRYESNCNNVLISADSNLMSRVFHNIIRNAIQAYNSAYSDNNLHIDIVCNLIKGENRIVINIKDNGPGISEEIRSKIFIPNFTTKSSGTGLGLAIVKNIIENTNGSIKLVEGRENGAEFEISLPVVGKE